MLKTTIIGGVVFLLPIGILLLVLSEVLEFVLKLAEPLVSLFSEGDYFGISIAGVLAVMAIVLACYLAGLGAQYSAVSGISTKTDRFLSGLLPGYGMMRGRIAAATNNESFGETRQVVSFQVAGLKRFAFVIEENSENDEVLVFLPSAPNVESGVLGYVPRATLTFESIAAHKVMRSFEFYGRGLSEHLASAAAQADK